MAVLPKADVAAGAPNTDVAGAAVPKAEVAGAGVPKTEVAGAAVPKADVAGAVVPNTEVAGLALLPNTEVVPKAEDVAGKAEPDAGVPNAEVVGADAVDCNVALCWTACSYACDILARRFW